MSFFFQSVLTRSLHFSVLEISCCSIFNEQLFSRFKVALHSRACLLYLNRRKKSICFFDFFQTFLRNVSLHKYTILLPLFCAFFTHFKAISRIIEGRDRWFLPIFLWNSSILYINTFRSLYTNIAIFSSFIIFRLKNLQSGKIVL